MLEDGELTLKQVPGAQALLLAKAALAVQSCPSPKERRTLWLERPVLGGYAAWDKDSSDWVFSEV